MTDKEKAKAYDEAIERANKVLLDCTKEERNVVEFLHPELKESEGERMRKWIINYLSNRMLNSTILVEKENLKKAIDWLENQGEQKPADKKGMNLMEEEMTPFQKKVFCIIDTAIEEEQGLKQVCDELLRLAHNEIMIEQKPVWSEEDENTRKKIIKFLEEQNYFDGKANEFKKPYEKEYEWLKSLKERIQPQNLTVTDEELIKARNEAYNDALDKLEYHSDTPTFKDGWSAAIWYLKKRNAQPQNTWKPSDEQMETLKFACGGNYVDLGVLESLYQDLKKLREE